MTSEQCSKFKILSYYLQVNEEFLQTLPLFLKTNHTPKQTIKERLELSWLTSVSLLKQVSGACLK